jgi:diphthamide synthase subunit DPH2
MQHLESLLNARNVPYMVVLLSEIFPSKLELFPDIDVYATLSLSLCGYYSLVCVRACVRVALG